MARYARAFVRRTEALDNVGALISRIGFWGVPYCKYNIPPKHYSNYEALYIIGFRVMHLLLGCPVLRRQEHQPALTQEALLRAAEALGILKGL